MVANSIGCGVVSVGTCGGGVYLGCGDRCGVVGAVTTVGAASVGGLSRCRLNGLSEENKDIRYVITVTTVSFVFIYARASFTRTPSDTTASGSRQAFDTPAGSRVARIVSRSLVQGSGT